MFVVYLSLLLSNVQMTFSNLHLMIARLLQSQTMEFIRPCKAIQIATNELNAVRVLTENCFMQRFMFNYMDKGKRLPHFGFHIYGYIQCCTIFSNLVFNFFR